MLLKETVSDMVSIVTLEIEKGEQLKPKGRRDEGTQRDRETHDA